MRYSKLLKFLLSPFMMGMTEDTGGGGDASASGSGGDAGSDFDMSGALDAIGDGLGFGSEDKDELNPNPDDATNPGDEPDGGAGTDADAGAGKQSDEKSPPASQDKASGSAPDAGGAAPNPGQGGVAPRTWRAEAAAEWEKLPETVKQEIVKREEDMFRGIEGYKQKAGFGDAFVQAIGDFIPTLKASNVDPFALTKGLFNAHITLASGTPEQKLALIQKMDQDYGLNLASMFQDPDYAPAVDPQVAGLRQELAALKSQLSGTQSQIQQETARQQAEIRTRLENEVNAFAADPANIYYKEVEHLLPQILASGLITGENRLKQAYDHAVMMNPATQAKELARRTAEASAKAASEAKAKAEAAAKAASANVRTRAKQASTAAPLGSIDDTLNEAFAKMTAKG